jgi:hypothetical protein
MLRKINKAKTLFASASCLIVTTNIYAVLLIPSIATLKVNIPSPIQMREY